MRTIHPAHGLDPRRFGRRAVAIPVPAPQPASFSDDLRLFGMTFAAGFLFVSILIA